MPKTVVKPAPARKRAARTAKASHLPPDLSKESAVAFWAGQFGTEYTARNRVNWLDRVPLLRQVIEETGASTFLDLGCNAGWNLLALRHLNPDFAMTGVDVNHVALAQAADLGFDVINLPAAEVCDVLGFACADMVITSGVLIHVPTEQLLATMQAAIDASAHYVLCIEYEAGQETPVEYRGHAGRLWKRPFGDIYVGMGLSLIEHGEAEGYDDCHYWLLEKTS